jgi:hypothetical protein
MINKPRRKFIAKRISHLLTEEEWRSIELFQRRSQELKAITIFSSDSQKYSAKLTMKVGDPVSFDIQLPEERDLKELLLVFRFFYLQKEPSNFLRVVNILSKYMQNELVTQVIRMYKKCWKDALFGQELLIFFNEEQLTAGKLLDLWFNAHYFHSAENAEQELAALNRALTPEFSKYMLVDSVLEATRLIFTVYDSIKYLSR